MTSKNPQTPKPEPSCPCCDSTNWFCYPEPVGNPFRHCNECDCKWDNRKRRTPATEPAAAEETGPVAERVAMDNRPEPTPENWLIVRADEYEVLRQIQFYAKGVYRSGEPRHCETRLLNFVEELEELEKDPLCCSYIYKAHPPAAQPLPAGGVDEEAERRLFETWAKPLHFDLSRRRFDHTYISGQTLAAWETWKASARSRLSQDVGVHDEVQALADRFPEINMSNYNEVDVEQLNAWGTELVTLLDRSRLLRGEGREQMEVQEPDQRPCQHPIGQTTCGYPEDTCMHEGSTAKAPSAGRHKYRPAALASDAAQGKSGE